MDMLHREASDSVVRNNLFLVSDQRRSLQIRVETILQQPFAEGNLNQHGETIQPLLAKEGTRLSTSKPHWFLLSQCVERVQKQDEARQLGKQAKMRKKVAQDMRRMGSQ